jgi:hypothetical protein
MNEARSRITTFVGPISLAVTLALIAAATPTLAQEAEKIDPFAGLKKVEDSKAGVAYIDPEADFGVFKKVAISDPYVAFRANWRRDVNRNRVRPISESQAERIRADVARLLKEVFVERLEKDGGYEVTKYTGYDVLLVKPALIDLDINPPEASPTAGASASMSASTGAATLYIELFDSVTGDILGRAADRQAAQTNRHFGLNTESLQEAQARTIFGGWAEALRGFLDEYHKKE